MSLVVRQSLSQSDTHSQFGLFCLPYILQNNDYRTFFVLQNMFLFSICLRLTRLHFVTHSVSAVTGVRFAL